MQINRMKAQLNDSLNVKGDFIEFGMNKGTAFLHLAETASSHGRMAYGIDSFEGLPEPTNEDRNTRGTVVSPKGKFKADYKVVNATLNHKINGDNYKIIKGNVPDVFNELPDTSYAFAIINLKQYKPTIETLKYIWGRMSYGGALYFTDYTPKENCAATKAINEFKELHEDETVVSRQMVVNGVREDELAIKCLRKEIKPEAWNFEGDLKRPIVFALVLKTGGPIYNHKYVNNIVNGIKSNVTLPHRIVCLTDNASGLSKDIDEIIPFENNWPKWWGKIELFRPDLFKDEQVFYFDLDTFIVNNIDGIIRYDGEFCALRDFYHLNTMGSGLMSWRGDRVHSIYRTFKSNPNHYMKQFEVAGDQAFINIFKPSISYFQDIFPNEILSYKVHCTNKKINKNAKIICFHGNPRPHELKDDLRKYWKQ